jgi:hypothetical protein
MNIQLLAAGFLKHLATSPPLYLLLWTGLGLATVGTMFAMRKWWGRIHPLHRCAALSLLVHLVLASLAMTIRLVSAGDGNGSGNGGGLPIHVRLIEDEGGNAMLTSIAPPQLLATAAAEEGKRASADVAPTTEAAADRTSLAPVDAPELLPAPPEPAKDAVVANDALQNLADAATTTATTPMASREEAKRETVSSQAEPPAGVVSPAENVAGEGPIGGLIAATIRGANPYARRGGGADRLHWAEQGGGGRETEAAVDAALKWLAENQSPDGRWDASRFGAGQEMAVLGQDRGGAGADADTGISALALLAFLGAGSTHRDGDYRSTVGKGLEFLLRGQAADGNLGGEAGLYAQMYCHSMATFALAEACAITGDLALKRPVERAVDYSLRAQNPATGGWRYRPGDMGDTSQLGWQLMALWSAERVGVTVPPQTWTGAERFLRSVRRGQSGGLASYRADGPVSTSMTAEALYCRQLVGESLDDGNDQTAADEATQRILRTLPEPTHVNLYYWYYASLALHRKQQASEQDAAAWQSWNSALVNALVGKQKYDGTDAGSWDPECIWGGYGGRVYSTALSALCLEVYYRYALPAAGVDSAAMRRDSTRSMH